MIGNLQSWRLVWAAQMEPSRGWKDTPTVLGAVLIGPSTHPASGAEGRCQQRHMHCCIRAHHRLHSSRLQNSQLRPERGRFLLSGVSMFATDLGQLLTLVNKRVNE